MRSSLNLGVLAIVLWICIATSSQGRENASYSEMKRREVESDADVSSGWEAGKQLLENIKKSEFVTTFSNLAKWALPLCQSIGHFAQLIMSFKKSESKELKYIKEQFNLINLKMDTMEQEFHVIKKLIDWNAVKVTFGDYERSIDSLQDRIVAISTAPADVSPFLRDQFITVYERTFRDATTKIYEGLVNSQNIYSENLVVAARKYTSNHRRQVQKFILGVTQLLIKGLQVEVMYMNFRNQKDVTQYWQNEWEVRLNKISNFCKQSDQEIVDGWASQIATDLEVFSANYHSLNNQQYVERLWPFITDKFPYRVWILLVYNPISGWDNHAVTHCGGLAQMRVRGHNIVVASLSADQPKLFDQATAQRALDSVPTTDRGMNGALSVLDGVKRVAPVDCSRYSLAASIKWGESLWFISDNSRRVYRKWESRVRRSTMNLILFG